MDGNMVETAPQATVPSTAEYAVDLLRRDFTSVFNLPALEDATAPFQSGEPFPHLIVDDFLAEDVAKAVEQSLLQEDNQFQVSFVDAAQKGKTISTGADVPLTIEMLAHRLASPAMIAFMEGITGVQSLIPDPFYNTNVGYYHMVKPGGRLAAHVDDSHHSTMAIPHTANVVIYLTPNWRDEDGGAFHLFDESGRTSLKRVSCKFNRAVFFRCSPVSYHGVEPIAGEANRVRHSLYFAYYNVKPSRAAGSFTLPSVGNGINDDQAYHGTHFPMSWRDLIKPENRIHLREQALGFAAMWVPPVVTSGFRKLRRKS